MTRKDSVLRKALKKDMPQMPFQMSARFDDTVSAFKGPTARHSIALRVTRAAALLLLVVFFVLPNVSPTIAYAMQDIPILGDLIKVFTIYKVDESDDNHYQKVEIPHIEGAEGENAAVDYINADVEELTSAVMAEYKATVAEYPDSHTGLLIDYEVITNTSQWFTLRLMVFRDGGSSNVQYYFYHIDKQAGKLVELSDLFREDFDYQSLISEEIKAQMRQQHSDNPNMIYWVDENDGTNYVFEQIAPDQNFYFDTDGALVIVFGKYEVAPGYMGCPEFTIPSRVYAEGLASASE